MVKTIQEYFRDWHSNAFGFGYGTGEPHTIKAVKTFLGLCNEGSLNNSYDYNKLEEALTPTVAWLMINILCNHDMDIIEYGTSPRYAWLTAKGKRLKEFVNKYNEEELLNIVLDYDDNYPQCYPTACNCGEYGYDEKAICLNPFWLDN